MIEFDHDDDVRDALWAASGEPCDTERAIRDVAARVRRIRRRRMDLAAAAILAAVLLTLGIASRSNGHDPAERPASVDSTTSTTLPTTAAPTTATTEAPAEAAAPPSTTPPDAAFAAPAPEEAAPEPTTAAEAPPETAAEATPSPPRQPESPPRTSRPAVDTGPAAVQQTFASRGGQVTVRLESGSLSLVAATARAGWTADPSATGGSHVEVAFRSVRGTSRISVDVVDGRLRPTITGSSSSTGDGGGRDGGSRDRPSTTTTASGGDGPGGTRRDRSGDYRDGWSRG